MQLPIIAGALGNVSLVDGEGYRAVSGVNRFGVHEVIVHPRPLLMRPMRFTRCGGAKDGFLSLPTAP